MESWELKAVLKSSSGAPSCADVERPGAGLGVDERAAEDVLEELEADLAAATVAGRYAGALMASGWSPSRSSRHCPRLRSPSGAQAHI